MKLLALGYVAAALCTMVAADTSKIPPYTCESDADCEKKFPNTVCITVTAYGVETKKCTPNTKARPACRGAQPGMCPSYQSPEDQYLNTQCIFIADNDAATASAGTSSASSKSKSSTDGSSSASATISRRHLMGMAGTTAPPKSSTPPLAPAHANVNASTAPAHNSSAATTTEAPATATDSSGSSTDTGSVGSVGGGSSSLDDEPAPKPKDSTIVTIKKVKVKGHFACVDVSDCENQAYDTSSCLPKTCGSAGSLEQCNTHGTCTYASWQNMAKRSCMCERGFGGPLCEHQLSKACDVDCGIGGDCVNSVCVCKKGFDGKTYKGKSGKPNDRCTKCTNDQACQNGNSCDTETGACVCSPGFSGLTCGATEDGCTTKKCGSGTCQVVGNGTGVCMCPLCSPTCIQCPTKDCSTCPSAAPHLELSKTVLLISAVVTVLVSNFAY